MYVDQVMFDKKGNKKLKYEVEIKAKELMHKRLPFDVLCWQLAELQLIVEKGKGNYSDHEVYEMEENIFNSPISYREICWLISTLECFIGQQELYPQIKIYR